MVSPGYSYEKAPEQDIFLSRERSHGLFSKDFQRWYRPMENLISLPFF